MRPNNEQSFNPHQWVYIFSLANAVRQSGFGIIKYYTKMDLDLLLGRIPVLTMAAISIPEIQRPVMNVLQQVIRAPYQLANRAQRDFPLIAITSYSSEENFSGKMLSAIYFWMIAPCVNAGVGDLFSAMPILPVPVLFFTRTLATLGALRITGEITAHLSSAYQSLANQLPRQSPFGLIIQTAVRENLVEITTNIIPYRYTYNGLMLANFAYYGDAILNSYPSLLFNLILYLVPLFPLEASHYFSLGTAKKVAATLGAAGKQVAERFNRSSLVLPPESRVSDIKTELAESLALILLTPMSQRVIKIAPGLLAYMAVLAGTAYFPQANIAAGAAYQYVSMLSTQLGENTPAILVALTQLLINLGLIKTVGGYAQHLKDKAIHWKLWWDAYRDPQKNAKLGAYYIERNEFESAIRVFDAVPQPWNEIFAYRAASQVEVVKQKLPIAKTEEDYDVAENLLKVVKPYYDRYVTEPPTINRMTFTRQVEWQILDAKISIYSEKAINKGFAKLLYLLYAKFDLQNYGKITPANPVFYPSAEIKSESLSQRVIPAFKEVMSWLKSNAITIMEQADSKEPVAALEFLRDKLDLYQTLSSYLIEAVAKSDEVIAEFSEAYATIQEILGSFNFCLAVCEMQRAETSELVTLICLGKQSEAILSMLRGEEHTALPYPVSEETTWQQVQGWAKNYKAEKKYSLAYVYYRYTVMLAEKNTPAYYRAQYNCGATLQETIQNFEHPQDRLEILLSAKKHFEIAANADGAITCTDTSRMPLGSQAQQVISSLNQRITQLRQQRYNERQELLIARGVF